MTVVLLIAGALVTSNEAGDSVPDWPLSFGRWLIQSDYFKANVRYEYSHRFIAGLVGITTFLFALATWFADKRKWMKKLALYALIAALAVFTSRSWFVDHDVQEDKGGVALRSLAPITVGCILAQLVLGAGY